MGVQNELWCIHQHLGIVGDEINLTLSFVDAVKFLALSQRRAELFWKEEAPLQQPNGTFGLWQGFQRVVSWGHKTPCNAHLAERNLPHCESLGLAC